MKPSSDLIIVLLPAPFGPSRPTAPSGNVALTSASARFVPYSTVRPSRVTAAAGRGWSGTGPPGALASGAVGMGGWSVATLMGGCWLIRDRAVPGSDTLSQAALQAKRL